MCGEYIAAVERLPTLDANAHQFAFAITLLFPSAEYALDAAKSDTLFICTEDDKICAAFVLSENPEGDYSKGAWSQNLLVGEYLVLHAFAVAPDCQRRGLGRKIVEYCLNFAA